MAFQQGGQGEAVQAQGPGEAHGALGACWRSGCVQKGPFPGDSCPLEAGGQGDRFSPRSHTHLLEISWVSHPFSTYVVGEAAGFMSPDLDLRVAEINATKQLGDSVTVIQLSLL